MTGDNLPTRRRFLQRILAGGSLLALPGDAPRTFPRPDDIPQPPADDPALTQAFAEAQANLQYAIHSAAADITRVRNRLIGGIMSLDQLQIVLSLPDEEHPGERSCYLRINGDERQEQLPGMTALLRACTELETLYECYNRERPAEQQRHLDYKAILSSVEQHATGVNLDAEVAGTLMSMFATAAKGQRPEPWGKTVSLHDPWRVWEREIGLTLITAFPTHSRFQERLPEARTTQR
ncbi:MAG: hypothetical protein KGJ06_01920 [Pseudomonadota bacterium]|nr:hypothetical protein [Pseudomonadota bacterium]